MRRLDRGDTPLADQLAADIADQLRRIAKAANGQSAGGRNGGLTGPQAAVLKRMLEAVSTSSAQLSRELNCTASNLTGIIDRLEEKGLVTRGKLENDRRVAPLQLTAKGRAVGRELVDPLADTLREGLLGAGPARATEMRRVLAEIIALLDKRP